MNRKRNIRWEPPTASRSAEERRQPRDGRAAMDGRTIMTDQTVPLGGANQLRRNSLGVGAVTFLVVSAAAPLTAVAGGVPLSMLLGNGPGIPLTFAFVTTVLLLFAVGYVAMARHISNAGAFYA